MRTFVDTSALYAVLDGDDASHPTAREQWRRLLERATPLLVTNYVLVESTALVQHRIGLDAVRALVTDMLPVLDVEWISAEDHGAAQAALLAADRRGLSLVDCTSLQVMRRLGLRTAFTFDRHFTQQGFQVVPRSDRVHDGGT